MKDEVSKKAHEESAQLACEAAGAIRTVAALTREQECCDIYSKSLEKPLESSTKAAIWSNAVYSFSQACIFFVIALVFWYGSRLVSSQEITIFEFFIALTVSSSPDCPSEIRLQSCHPGNNLWRAAGWWCFRFCTRHFVRSRRWFGSTQALRFYARD